MTATVLSQLSDLVDALVRINAPAGTTVWRDRADAFSREEAPAVNQLWREGPVEAISDDMDLHTWDMELQMMVRAEPFTTAVEDLHRRLHPALMHNAGIASLAESVRLVEQAVELGEADVTAGKKIARYRFKYLIPKDTL